MTARCFNPACSAPFRYFRSGKIFAISSASRKRSDDNGDTEYFWLCGKCSPQLRVSVNAAGAVILESASPRTIIQSDTRVSISTPEQKSLRAVSG
jgi:hypothetical protein